MFFPVFHQSGSVIPETLTLQSEHCLHLVKSVSGLRGVVLGNWHVFCVMQLVGHMLGDDRLAESLVESLSVRAS